MRLRAGQRTGRITATDVTKGITAGGRSQRTHDGGLISLHPCILASFAFSSGNSWVAVRFVPKDANGREAAQSSRPTALTRSEEADLCLALTRLSGF